MLLPPQRLLNAWMLSTLLGLLLGGCDMLGLPNPAKEAAQVEAEAKAVGAGCRHSGRSLEDCYALYPDQSRAQVFAGWKEMQDYMASGNLTAVEPTIERDAPKSPDASADAADEDAPRRRLSKKRSSDDETPERHRRGAREKGDSTKHANAEEH